MRNFLFFENCISNKIKSTVFRIIYRFVLSQILSDQNLDDKFANIHARLRQLKIDLEENKVPTPLLAITKQLTKNPEEYPDKKSLPHVQVAIRMNLTMAKKFRQGDTIAYIICEVINFFLHFYLNL